MDKFVDVTLESVQTMYATLWMTAWYKIMGVGLTWDTEVSTKINYFDLVKIGASSFIADDGKKNGGMILLLAINCGPTF